jgi:hypothetical protein
MDSNKGIENEEVFNLQQTYNRQEQVEQEILQQQVLRQSDNAKESIKGGKQKKSAKGNQINQMPELQQECQNSTTSRGLQQTIGSGNSLPEMSHKKRNGVRQMGASENRIDRLRLLGNGVVPQQAEKAFRELIKIFNHG